jgi:hypothetical protein
MATTVSNLKATLTTPTSVTLTWTAADERPLVDIEIDGTIIQSGYSGTSYVHTITAGGQHNYRLRTVQGGFSPSNIAWHSLFWAEGEAFTALGLANDASVFLWPNETGETDATGSGWVPNYRTDGGADYNNRPVVDFDNNVQSVLKALVWNTQPGATRTYIVVGNRGVNSGTYGTIFDGDTTDASRRAKIGMNIGQTFWSTAIGTTSDIDTNIVPDFVPHLFELRTSTALTDRFKIDGIVGYEGNAGNSDTRGVCIGNYAVNSYSARGKIAFVGVYDGDFSQDPNYPAFCQWVTEHYGISTGISSQMTGGTVSVPGDGYVYHTFTTSGTLAPIGDPVEVEYLVVAGGGPGENNYGGGGGAGGMRAGAVTLPAERTVTIGGGGAPTGSSGGVGTASSLGAVSSAGGGGGSTRNSEADGTAGGSGGGGGGTAGNLGNGGAGVAGQGNEGGDGYLLIGDAGTNSAGGGGGGAGGVGANAASTAGGNGGAGLEWPASSGTYYAGGGGGTGQLTAGTGGSGGGGTGATEASPNGTTGTANKGGGGGGAWGGSAAGVGGSGIVIARYPVDYAWTPISPDSIATLAAWYDASDTGTITSSGGAVSQWNDKSGNGWHLSQSTEGDKPTTGANTVNGLNVLDFGGTKHLLNSSYNENTRCTMFAVIKVVASTYIQQAVCFQNQQHPISISDTESIVAYNGNYWSGAPESATGRSGVLLASSRIHASPGERWVRVNGTQSNGTNSVGTSAATKLVVGGNPGETQYLTGGAQVMEVIVYADLASPLSVSEVSAVEGYLIDKWGVV